MTASPITPAPGPGMAHRRPRRGHPAGVNEARYLEKNLSELLAGHPFDEVIVVDGGSTDASVEIVCKLMSADTSGTQPVPYLIQAPRVTRPSNGCRRTGRTSDALLFLHADAVAARRCHRAYPRRCPSRPSVGRFDVRLSGRHFLFRVIEGLDELALAYKRNPTGDQGLSLRRDVYRHAGRVCAVALMEDIEFSRG